MPPRLSRLIENPVQPLDNFVRRRLRRRAAAQSAFHDVAAFQRQPRQNLRVRRGFCDIREEMPGSAAAMGAERDHHFAGEVVLAEKSPQRRSERPVPDRTANENDVIVRDVFVERQDLRLDVVVQMVFGFLQHLLLLQKVL